MKKELIQLLLTRASKETTIGASTFYNHLHKWPDKEAKIEEVLTQCLINMHRRFREGSSQAKPDAGFTRLFSSSQIIGAYFYMAMNGFEENTPKRLRKEVHGGSAVIDALIDLQCITCDRGNYYRAPYQLMQGPKWKTLISELSPSALITPSISFTKPKPIDTFLSSITGRKIVKRGTTRSDFEKMKGTTFTKGCDVLQQTPWRINKDVFEIIRDHSWMHQSSDGKFVIMDKEEVIPDAGSPTKVKNLMERLKKYPDNEKLKAELDVAHIEWEHKKSIMSRKSKLLERESIVKTASVLVKQPEFFYAIEADYRGRIYYSHPVLHYQGSDLAKGLLEFSNGVVLNETGFKWLLIHAACCYNASVGQQSIDKLSLEAREEWARSNITFIKSIAKRKIVDYDAEKPIMFLAACIEISNAIEHWSNDIPFITHLPVPIDGANNGSQHCAAINRDLQTASQVGMIATPDPIDLYSNVGMKVMRMLPAFFDKNGMTMKDVRKNIAKRSTMVRGYSAGAESIAQNMFSDCYKNGLTEKYGITYKDCKLLAHICIAAIDDVCPSNRTVQKYLQEIVKYEIGKYTQNKNKEWELSYGNGMSDISWTAPSGFVVRVVKTTWRNLEVNIQLQGSGICLQGRWPTDRANIKDHVSGIAANVIHSMDASHLLKCATHFEGESFAGVHDSFAVHANEVDNLIKVVKEEFIAMYNGNDFYEYIKNEILSDTQGFNVKAPELGDYQLDQLRDSNYFFC